MVMGRNGMGRNDYGPKWAWAEVVMGRNDPEQGEKLKEILPCIGKSYKYLDLVIVLFNPLKGVKMSVRLLMRQLIINK